jgi:general secretion pathway protein K
MPGDGQALLPLLGPAQAYAGTEASKAARVTVHIAFDDGFQTSTEVVIVTFEQGNEPYSVLSWRDQLNQPPANGALGMASR